MEKKAECEIVQDLLIGYHDGVLNQESKKFSEKHLNECKKCRTKLEEIELEMQKEEGRQKKEIDYLKKVRKKSKVKSILLAGVILLMILAIGLLEFYGYKFLVIRSISWKMDDLLGEKNFYIEQVRDSNSENGDTFISKIWYKDGKCKVVSYKIKEDGNAEPLLTQYVDTNKSVRDIYVLNEKTKKVHKSESAYELNDDYFVSVLNPIFMPNSNRNLRYFLTRPFYTKISTDDKVIRAKAKEYFVLTSYLQDAELAVDKETGLPIRSISRSTDLSEEYVGSAIQKIKDVEYTTQYYHEFGHVRDEEVQMPDLSHYETEVFQYEGDENVTNQTVLWF